ncbi:MAG: hypothetical protein JSS83_07775 [Cyanobacteria bacterium SZAS LIN-3]|nr:hypothetical protein [Cyanobacteria bacterium SZAS LIN-3]MBS2005463.1 hypothetical protein [Cyanobacteria bacterium SZAS TMP-1]
MALSERQKSNAVATVRLMQTTTVPTTEELLYMLGIAKKNGKPVELRFKNPYNNITFMVRVSPGTIQFPPRWDFHRCEAGQTIFLWTRQTNEVIMVQGKIKIESNYSGEVTTEADSEEEMPESFRTTGSQPIIMGSPSNSQSNLHPIIASLDQSQSDNLSSTGTWLFDQKNAGPVMMPPPVALNVDVLNNYMSALSNPATGFLRHTAFEFFLLRDVQYVQKFGGRLSVAVFDFSDSETEKTHDVADTVSQILSESLQDLFSPLELCTQLRSGEFAVLLCGYDGEKALNYAKTLWTRLTNSAPVGSACADSDSMAVGVACIPETTKDPGVLLAAAIKAKNLARQAKRGYMLFPLF